MSVAYGGTPGGYAPPGRVNFAWINESFELFKANAAVWIVAVLLSLVPAVLGFIVGAIVGVQAGLSGHPAPTPTDPGAAFMNGLTGGLPPALSLGIRIVSALWTAWLYGGIYQVAVRQVRGEVTSPGDLFSGGPLLGKMLGFNIVYGLAAAVGFVLCIVPGLLVAGLLLPAYALIADGETVGNAIARSVDAMKRDLVNAALFAVVMGLVLMAGFLACGVGAFVTLPMFYLTGALAYRDMIGMPNLGAPAAPFGSPYGAAPGVTPGVWPPPPGAAAPPVFNPPPPASSQPPPPAPEPPPAAPPRRSLGGDPLDEEGTPPR